ncbi:MAG: glycosyltransferase [Chloroflexota bacterium]
MIFDLDITGHHPDYIRHLVHYWPVTDHPLAMTRLVIVVSPEFLDQHQHVVESPSHAQVEWCPITADELQWYHACRGSLMRHAWVEWRLFCRYAKKFQADQALVMYVDRLQLMLALRRPLPCPFSGIYFRPKFHYFQYTQQSESTQRERLQTQAKKWICHRFLHHNQLKTLFCLDPSAVSPLQSLAAGRHHGRHHGGREVNIVHLPDPVELYPQSHKQPDEQTTHATLRQKLGFDAKRTVFLIFGMIDKRKGVYQILDAIQQLTGPQQSAVSLLLVGPLAEDDRQRIQTTVQAIQQQTQVHIVTHDQFVIDEEIQPYFEIADIVLTLYQRHVGMSAILVRAAMACKPVLASSYGLVGELVRTRQLGVTVDSQSPDAVMRGIQQCLGSEPENLFNRAEATRFAGENSPKRFAQVIVDGMIGINAESDT